MTEERGEDKLQKSMTYFSLEFLWENVVVQRCFCQNLCRIGQPEKHAQEILEVRDSSH